MTISKINSMTFECESAIIQVNAGYLSLWLDGDISKESDADISIELIKEIVETSSKVTQ